MTGIGVETIHDTDTSTMDHTDALRLAPEIPGSLPREFPSLAFNGNPDIIPVHIPEPMQESYQDMRLERIDSETENFFELATDYLRIVLHKDNIKSGAFTWPSFKLPKDWADRPDNELFTEDGSPQKHLVELAYERYIRKTVEKDNNLVVLRGLIDGEEKVIGGGLSFPGVGNEDEGWMSKGVIAKHTNGTQHRGKGFGRVLQSGRIMNWMLRYPDKDNLNTGVNVDSHESSPREHRVSYQLIGGSDILEWLIRDEGDVTAARLETQIRSNYQFLVDRGIPADELPDLDSLLEELVGEDSRLLPRLPVRGFSEASMEVRKDVMKAVARATGEDLTETEKNVLTQGGYLLNAIPNSAVVMDGTDRAAVDDSVIAEEPLLAHTRRVLIRRANWLRLQDDTVTDYLANQAA